MTETLDATFARIRSAFGIELPPSPETLRRLQNREIPLEGREEMVARMVAPHLLAYNTSYERIGAMLEDCLSEAYRRQMVDDFGGGWVYSWHCMDHMGYMHNPRYKDVGYGNVFRFYRQALAQWSQGQDELNWHFHPVSITGHPLHAATSYVNAYPMLTEILCRRILEDRWFPVVNRPGFHSERPDSHAFLEQWIPFDYANQSHEDDVDQPDLAGGRFGDWRRAPKSWRAYHPHHDDHQLEGACRRIIFRCLNVGTRLRTLNMSHVHEAFTEARQHGVAVLAFANHDYRDIRPDVATVRDMLEKTRALYPDVRIRFSGAEAAARELIGAVDAPPLKLGITLNGTRLDIGVVQGRVFGPQPYLALQGRDGKVYHDNLDIQEPGLRWSYQLDEQTLPIGALSRVAVASAGRFGGFDVAQLDMEA
ncbi:MAG: hypothetical protein QM742_11885 [Aquabacterium sp.]